MAEVTLYGIPNCDTVKKARRWLDEHGVDYIFHNFKKDGVPTKELAEWTDTHGLELLVNRRGTTWRKLSEDRKAQLEAGTDAAQRVLQEEPSMIKRPVLAMGGITLLGFDASDWHTTLDL